ncbi:MAG: response regulator, partial [Desulfobacterales bacterium]|nr:response regulator [Desulfobacterales bacterium]
LTAQLLGYARKGRYEITTINLNNLVRETAETVGRTNKQVTVTMDLAKDLHSVKVDRGQMEQVLFNLFINAVDAMPAGGILSLKTINGSEEMMSDRVYRPKAGSYVMLTVTDNGIGIDSQTRARIFDPFFTTKEMGRGTGLGLASVYGIIKGHTGYVDVDSKPGEGATFSVCLPATEVAVPALNEQVSVGPIKGQGTVLLVDDEAVILEVGKEYLQVMGYTVHTARGGRDALAVFTAEYRRLDLVILDMIMPDIGGGEVYDRFKTIDRDVKVLLSSGYSLNGQASEILARGCNGFIQKPFGMRTLSLKIREILEG